MSPPGVYLAGPLGFTESGRNYHDNVVRPAVAALGVEILDPWFSADVILEQDAERLVGDESLESLARANDLIGRSNQQMIERCAVVLAILDGVDVDSGTAAEIGFAYAIGRPIVGLRSDLRRSGENIATPVNLQIAHFVRASGGEIVRTLDKAIASLAGLLR